eukprot:CAMPEP_0204004454 /NCGR_PEP_ID=MMETSP0360-20130528/18384_1 /ASSEMBLY_ACC=CAM_ASM_000342 /TAXON_ID=268821 /ORGANISM="Scrippsiella Hangoei, Strain SHTV-5" /LENGTH=40 /DNA_ID= /DNA_START= /DNA_END= /DNA_ORIENTATION=
MIAALLLVCGLLRAAQGVLGVARELTAHASPPSVLEALVA